MTPRDTTAAQREARYLIIKAHQLALRMDQTTQLILSDYTKGFIKRPHAIRQGQLDAMRNLALSEGTDQQSRAIGNEIADTLTELEVWADIIPAPVVRPDSAEPDVIAKLLEDAEADGDAEPYQPARLRFASRSPTKPAAGRGSGASRR